MRRIIVSWLTSAPVSEQHALTSYRYLIFDGTYLVKRVGMIVLMHATTHTIIRGRYGLSEVPRDMLPFFTALRQDGLAPVSVTVDGNPHVIRIFRQFWPGVIMQRCLVHVQRQGLMWCRRYPKRTDAKKLRLIFLLVTSIHSIVERDHWLQQLASWEERYGRHIASSQETGWVFSDLKRARSMVLGAVPDMFHYLDDPSIPCTTNGLEGYFARLKQRYRQHRGLSPARRDHYFQWYFYICKH